MKNINIKSLSISTSATIIAITLLTILSEISKAIKKYIAYTTGHHWTSKGLISILIFIIVYLLYYKIEEEKDIAKYIYTTIIIALLGILIIMGFFLFDFFLD